MIKFTIEGTETDCAVLPVPKGCFTEWEGLYDFPAFVVIGSAERPFDKYHHVVTMPVMEIDPNGMQILHKQSIYTTLKYRSFIRMVEKFPKDIGLSLEECVTNILEEMKDHGVPVHPFVRKTIKNKDYLKINSIRKAWNLDRIEI